jgi:group I intron endonuclease
MSETKIKLFNDNPANNPMYGKKHSSETKTKISLSNKNRKAILCLDAKRNIIKQYECVRDAERETSIDHSSISRCCRNKQKTAGGYIWEFV